ncbi:hypothetical protein M9435_006920 [Picochlorum sp. BPE23]|nr:hypothetical protein M9435_006920 [Picochlorum sp. BPE23]
MDSPDGLRHVSFLQRRPHRIEIFQSNKATLVLPSWCRTWPYPADNCKWQQYTSAILSGNKLCFWPSIPKQEGAGDSAVHLNTTAWASKFADNGTKVDQIMVAGGFFDNFWHAAAIFNTWCNIKHQEDVHFLVQSESMPSFVPIVANALGIQRSRIIHHTGPVLVESVLMAPYHGNVDWSCLHGALSTTSKQARDFIVVYFRGWDDPSRNIPEDIHYQFVSLLSHTFKHLQVKTFSGNETFEDNRELFQRARVVVGPHGAGMVNLVFCKEGTPVIEFTVHSLLNRPWQAMGAQSFGLKWWPVLLQNFSSADEITASVSIVQHALALS